MRTALRGICAFSLLRFGFHLVWPCKWGLAHYVVFTATGPEVTNNSTSQHYCQSLRSLMRKKRIITTCTLAHRHTQKWWGILAANLYVWVKITQLHTQRQTAVCTYKDVEVCRCPCVNGAPMAFTVSLCFNLQTRRLFTSEATKMVPL